MKKAFFWILILALLVYSGIKFGMPYYRYLAFKYDTKEIVRVSIELKSEEEIKEKVFERAQELKIPINKEDIEVSKTPKMVQVRTSWFEGVDILGIYHTTLTFTVDLGE
jgi:preprotein translocase subunit SecF